MTDWMMSHRREAFLLGKDTLTAQEVRDWAFELNGVMPPPSHVPPSQPVMVAIVTSLDTRGLSGATIIPGVG